MLLLRQRGNPMGMGLSRSQRVRRRRETANTLVQRGDVGA